MVDPVLIALGLHLVQADLAKLRAGPGLRRLTIHDPNSADLAALHDALPEVQIELH